MKLWILKFAGMGGQADLVDLPVAAANAAPLPPRAEDGIRNVLEASGLLKAARPEIALKLIKQKKCLMDKTLYDLGAPTAVLRRTQCRAR